MYLCMLCMIVTDVMYARVVFMFAMSLCMLCILCMDDVCCMRVM